MCIAGFWIAYAQPPFRKFRVLGRFWRIDWPLLGELFAVGAPIAGAFLLEYGLFAMAAIMMGWIGTVALAAHQVALQTAAILFMVPFGISMAATVRVGHAVGRDDADAARRAGFAAIGLGAAFMATMVLVIVGCRHLIPILFLGPPNDAEASSTIALAATLLAFGSTFFVADGVQTIAAGALRGLNDTRVPLIFAALSFWAIGFTTSYTLAFTAGLQAIGIWSGFTVGLAVYAALLVWRFNALTRRGYMPEAPGIEAQEKAHSAIPKELLVDRHFAVQNAPHGQRVAGRHEIVEDDVWMNHGDPQIRTEIWPWRTAFRKSAQSVKRLSEAAPIVLGRAAAGLTAEEGQNCGKIALGQRCEGEARHRERSASMPSSRRARNSSPSMTSPRATCARASSM